jgi:DNA-binding transcriptional regulator YdaS (Cro superfamily)
LIASFSAFLYTPYQQISSSNIFARSNIVVIAPNLRAVVTRLRNEEGLKVRYSRREKAEQAFTDWVAAMGGAREVALLVGVSRSTVYAWIHHHVAPKEKAILAIVLASCGQLTWEQVELATEQARKKVKGKPGRPRTRHKKKKKTIDPLADFRAHEVKP